MTSIPVWLKRVAASTGALFLFCYLTIMFIPATELRRLAARAIAPHGLSLDVTSLDKTFPIGIRARGATLSSPSGKILSFDSLSFKLNLLPLFAGRVIFFVSAGIGAGRVEGEAEITRSGRIDLTCSKVKLEDIPFFTTVAGTEARGVLRIRGELAGKGIAAKGYLQVEASDLDLKGVKISGTPLPDASYKNMQGIVRIAGGRASLESVTLLGDSLYVRLSGDLPAGTNPAATPLNLKLEMMPKPEFLESQKFIFLILIKYMTTPGHYQLPIRGTLASPVLQ